MKLEDFQIEPPMFFRVGMGCFAVIVVANIFTLLFFWETTFVMSKVASIAGIVFNIVMVLFFNYLLNMSKTQVTTDYASDDVNEIIQKIKEGNSGKHLRTKKEGGRDTLRNKKASS